MRTPRIHALRLVAEKAAMLMPVKGLARSAAVLAAAGALLAGAATAADAAPAAPGAGHAAVSWPTTLRQAETRWPGARLVAAGAAVRPGRYLIKDQSGHYGLMSVSVAVSAPGTAAPSSHIERASAASAYCTGCTYGVTVNVDTSSELFGEQSLSTYNGVDYGYDAWNISETPGCSGAGSCQAPQLGVIGNRSAEVNPWDNQYVNYWGCCSGTAYLRVYVTDHLGISAWATLDV